MCLQQGHTSRKCRRRRVHQEHESSPDPSPDQQDQKLVNNVPSNVLVQSVNDSSTQSEGSFTGAFQVFINLVLLYLFRCMAPFGRLSLRKLCACVVSVGVFFLTFSRLSSVNIPRPSVLC